VGGGLSYSLYLWHWPLLAAAMSNGGIGGRRAILIVALTFVPAWLSQRLVENPIRYSATLNDPRRALAVGLASIMTGVVAGVTLFLSVPGPPPEVGPDGRLPQGAAVLTSSPKGDSSGAPVDQVDWMTPGPIYALGDDPKNASSCQQNSVSTMPLTCIFGDPNGAVTVAVVGDSKANQWIPALEVVANHRHWKLVTYTKSGCAFTSAVILDIKQEKPYTSCAEWNVNVRLALTHEVHPALVITSQQTGQAITNGRPGETGHDVMVAGLRRTWATLTSAGSKVVVLKDNPHVAADNDVASCVEKHSQELKRCSLPRAMGETLSAGGAQMAAAQGARDVKLIDLTDAICPTAYCAPVIGNVLVYRQGSHVTATYMRTLAPRLDHALAS
jgi:hypothetical protein